MIWTVPKIWSGETAFILAGGPSLRGFDAAPLIKLPKSRIITINDSWRLAALWRWSLKDDPMVIHYFCEAYWWQKQQAWNRRTPDQQHCFHDAIYKGFWVNGHAGFGAHPQVRQLRFNGESGLSDDPAALRHGHNSGYAAINLAYLLGAARIILLGYDMKVDGGRSHWHNDGSMTVAEYQKTCDRDFLPHFPSLIAPLGAAGVEVLNATPDSALQCWPMVKLEEVLSGTGCAA